MEKQLRCKDCKGIVAALYEEGVYYCYWDGKPVNPGQFACKRFVYKDK